MYSSANRTNTWGSYMSEVPCAFKGRALSVYSSANRTNTWRSYMSEVPCVFKGRALNVYSSANRTNTWGSYMSVCIRVLIELITGALTCGANRVNNFYM